MMMRARFYHSFLVFLLQIIPLCLAGMTTTTRSRHFPKNFGFAVNNHNNSNNQGTIQDPQSLQINHTSNQLKGMNRKMGMWASKDKEMEKVGSRPPSCDHKCYGCRPCEAIQVPTTTTSRIVGVQYTNYEPEGWKCKCGPTFYSP
ncbi:hypothetical protein OROMI_004458 [Orobanche minor]